MAANINLLPWRAKRRKQREREFYTLLGFAAILGVLLVLAGIFFYNARIDHQKARNTYLTRQIEALNEQIKEIEQLEERRRQLIARKEVIEKLQADRTRMVHLFDELVRTIPEGVRLTAIKQAGPQLTLEGLAESHSRVSMYMRSLEDSDWLTSPDLNIIDAKGEDQRSRFAFTLRVQMTTPGASEKKEEADTFALAGPGGSP
jgi:type IV pilus assembly protein PilN